MRRLLKFFHTVGAAGLTGGAAVLAIVLIQAPSSIEMAGYAASLQAMSQIAAWIIGPSMVLTVATGLLAMVATPPFQDAGWVWAKAATGILVLQGGLHVMGPIQDKAKQVADKLAAGSDAATAAQLIAAEVNTLWLLLVVSVANFALGVWRPRFPKYRV